MDEQQIKDLFKKIPSKVPEKGFVSDLFDKIENRADKIYAHKKKKKTKSFLFPWQMSLFLASLGFVAILSFAIIASPTTLDKINGYMKQDAKSALSDEVMVTVPHDYDNVSVFVFNLLEEDSPPLDIPVQKSNKDLVFGLYPGRYRIVFVKDGVPVYEEKVTVKLGQNNLDLDINWEK